MVFLALYSPLDAGERTKVFIASTSDGTKQPSYVILPDGFDLDGDAVPLLVSLHSWSANLEQRNEPLEQLANQRGWLYLFPNFRGRNDNPAACGSELAQQDILDAVEWARMKYPIDERRIYLTGVSGGGHMTMLMAGRYPKVWAAASAWVGISDLAAWHKKHAGSKYGNMMEAACGGAPGTSKAVDDEFRKRSPLTYLSRATELPIDIAAGIHDGYTGSVPTQHSLEAFNVIAKAAGGKQISEDEIEQISRRNGRLAKPLPSDRVKDTSFGREIHLRRTAGNARVTIFRRVGTKESQRQRLPGWKCTTRTDTSPQTVSRWPTPIASRLTTTLAGLLQPRPTAQVDARKLERFKLQIDRRFIDFKEAMYLNGCVGVPCRRCHGCPRNPEVARFSIRW